MKIIVAGTRGVPNVLGGVETHCQELFPRIAKLGHDVTLIRRSSYITSDNKIAEFKGVKLKDIFAPRQKTIEAIVHTFLSIIYAWKQKPDILHIHAIGPSLLVPFARLLGLKVVVTNHGPDYERKKWGRIAKFFLIQGEKLGTKYANKIIVISEVINSILKVKYKRNDCCLIHNGVNIPELSLQTNYLDELELTPGKYIIAVGRFVEEKGFHDLINAFSAIEQSYYKLVLVGDADHESEYSKNLKFKAKQHNVTLTGFIKAEKLNQVFSHAALFVMPSYHEGLPIALLEALSYNLDVIVSDIPANIEINLDRDDYYKTGNIKDLTDRLRMKIKFQKHKNYSNLLKLKYNWDSIALQTLGLYESCI